MKRPSNPELLPGMVVLALAALITPPLFLLVYYVAHINISSERPAPLLVLDLVAWRTPRSADTVRPVPAQVVPQTKPREQKPRPTKKSALALDKNTAPVPKNPPKAPTPAEIAQAPDAQPPPANKPLSDSAPEQEISEHTPLLDRNNNTQPPIKPVPYFQLTQTPQFLHKEQPVYPEAMRVLGQSAVVKLQALIDDEGRVRQVQILESAGMQFDTAAEHAILASRFTPATVGDKPVAVWLRIPVRFRLH